MNIFISSSSMLDSANNLDNKRVKRQAMQLAQIISNIVWVNDDYTDIITTIKKSAMKYDLNKGFEYLMFPKEQSNHSAVVWGSKSPLHTLFLVEYLNKCVYVINTRGYSLTPTLSCAFKVAMWLRQYLMEVIPTIQLSALMGLDNDLYRNTPKTFDKEKDTIISYQKYLTAQWKSDILKYEKYQQDKLDYSKLPLADRNIANKPRIVKKLLWRNSTNAPEFAIKELKEFINAQRNAI